MNAFLILQAAVAAILSMTFNDGSVPGVEGQAVLFDGFDTRIVVPAADVKTPEKSFTVDVWVCPLAFPKSPCPVVCRQGNEAPGGWSLWLDAWGKVHFQVASAGEWTEVASSFGLPLRQWSRLTAVFCSKCSIRLAVDGQQVDKKSLSLTSVEQAEYDVWIGRTPVKTPSFLENKSIPIFSSFDGAMDQLQIFAGKDPYNAVLKQRFVRPAAPGTDVPGFEERILPSGPDQLAFGSWYIPLRFYKAFDDRWRGDIPDVVVGFGKDQPWKVVFWRGVSYAPCFVTEKGNWLCNEFIERAKVTKWGCPESMSDKHADFSSVRIIENTPARTVVIWRNIPVGLNQKIPFQSEETLWGDCSEETYIFYPDGACVRKMDLWTSAPNAWSEWSQSIQVLHPSQRPEDVLDASRIMSVATMDGRSEMYGWDFEGPRKQDSPSLEGANIQVTYLNSEWNPFLILEDTDGVNEKGGRGPRIDRYSGRWSEYSLFPWRNHWPVTQDYVMGRYACVADAASQTYTATQYNAPHRVECIIPGKSRGYVVAGHEPPYTSKTTPEELSSTWKITKLMLCGCTRGDAENLLPLAKSWLRAPKMTCDGQDVPYDVTQRAYMAKSDSRVFTVAASEEHPVNGLCMMIPGADELPSGITVNGAAFTDYKAGINQTPGGCSLILWLNLQVASPVEINRL